MCMQCASWRSIYFKPQIQAAYLFIMCIGLYLCVWPEYFFLNALISSIAILNSWDDALKDAVVSHSRPFGELGIVWVLVGTNVTYFLLVRGAQEYGHLVQHYGKMILEGVRQ
mmetsp:Transcript_24068/g.44988  ORF Transcript_24068/g.44988 Transcript_24068/m.44988 type:complete len:112 (+) Transcript_24068:273-608(+)